ncbi:MAG: hypothetical protein AAFQ65_01480 [Myxococcota bacterium]
MTNEATNTPRPSAAEVQAVLIRGGIDPEEAQRCATKMMAYKYVDRIIRLEVFHASLVDFPHHALVTALLAEMRAILGFTPARLAELVHASSNWVVARPDGVVVNVGTGDPIGAIDELQVEDGRLMAGPLELGRLYFAESRTICLLDPGFRPGDVVTTDLDLEEVAATEAQTDVQRIRRFLNTAPLEARIYQRFSSILRRVVDDLEYVLGRVPESIARAPAQWKALAHLPQLEKVEPTSKLLVSGLLLAVGYGQFQAAMASLDGDLLAKAGGSFKWPITGNGDEAAVTDDGARSEPDSSDFAFRWTIARGLTYATSTAPGDETPQTKSSRTPETAPRLHRSKDGSASVNQDASITHEDVTSHLCRGDALSCELSADHGDRRRFAYIRSYHGEQPASAADSDDRAFVVGTFEIPVEVLDAEARGQVMDQIDHQYDHQQYPVQGTAAALQMLDRICIGRTVVQSLQDDRWFEPPILI